MICPECKEESTKDVVCTNCGLVFEDRPIDYSPSRLRKKEESEQSTHNIFRSVFLTNIEDSTKVNLSECYDPNLKRALKKIYSPWKTRRETIIRNEIKRISTDLGLGKDFIVSCVFLFNKISKFDECCDKKLFKGGKEFSLEIAAQAIVYLEMRLRKLPFTLYDFDKIDCDRKVVSKFYRRILSEMNIKIMRQKSHSFIYRIANELGLNEKDKNDLILEATKMSVTIEFMERHYDRKARFKNPVILAGAVVYILAKKYKITQKQICEIIGCNHQTLRTRLAEIADLI